VTRAVSDACAEAGVPFVWGTALAFDGQVSTFWDARGIDFHDLHPEPLPDEGSCAVDGVLPALCHAVGAVMAAQVPALVAGIGEPLLGTVLTVDARTWRWTASPLRRGPASQRPASHRPARAAEPATRATGAAAPEVIRASRLAELLDGPEPPVLVDVRTDVERSLGVIPGAVRPADVPADADDLVVYCARGPRAEAWAEAREHGRVRVLEGGIGAWIDAVGKLVPDTSNPVS
jgi:rhodanese-related sulfurtransferase